MGSSAPAAPASAAAAAAGERSGVPGCCTAASCGLGPCPGTYSSSSVDADVQELLASLVDSDSSARLRLPFCACPRCPVSPGIARSWGWSCSAADATGGAGQAGFCHAPAGQPWRASSTLPVPVRSPTLAVCIPLCCRCQPAAPTLARCVPLRSKAISMRRCAPWQAVPAGCRSRPPTPSQPRPCASWDTALGCPCGMRCQVAAADPTHVQSAGALASCVWAAARPCQACIEQTGCCGAPSAVQETPAVLL